VRRTRSEAVDCSVCVCNRRNKNVLKRSLLFSGNIHGYYKSQYIALGSWLVSASATKALGVTATRTSSTVWYLLHSLMKRLHYWSRNLNREEWSILSGFLGVLCNLQDGSPTVNPSDHAVVVKFKMLLTEDLKKGWAVLWTNLSDELLAVYIDPRSKDFEYV